MDKRNTHKIGEKQQMTPDKKENKAIPKNPKVPPPQGKAAKMLRHMAMKGAATE